MKKLTLLGIGLSFLFTTAYADNVNKPNNNALLVPSTPPGLVKQDKTPPGLAKQGKTPQGWSKGKKNRGKNKSSSYHSHHYHKKSLQTLQKSSKSGDLKVKD